MADKNDDMQIATAAALSLIDKRVEDAHKVGIASATGKQRLRQALTGARDLRIKSRSMELLLGRLSSATLAGEFPECVAIGNVERGYFASGVLLSSEWLLTCAHCRDATRMYAGLDISGSPNVFDMRFTAERDLLALFKVEDFRQNVVAPKLPTDRCLLVRGTPLRVVAYGDTDPDGGGFGQQRKARFMIEDALNVRIYASSDSAVCPGDSGGPAFYDDGSQPPRTLLGICDSMLGADCASGGGVFATLVGKKTWIETTTGITFASTCPDPSTLQAR
jgi:hypothetical protein